MVVGSTLDEVDDSSGSCGVEGTADAEYVFTAPADGSYTFDTRGSVLNTVLYVLDGECVGDEIACDDNGDGAQSVLAVELVADQTVTVVVDSISLDGAAFELHVRAGALLCPTADLGDVVPTVVAGDTQGAYRNHASSCGGGAGPDLGYVFTAPQDDDYVFDSAGSSFSSILTVRDGACDGAELSCGYGGAIAALSAGQSVVVMVDSSYASGPFELHIGTLGGSCPDADLGAGVPNAASGDTSDADNTLAGSCGGLGARDDAYLFTASQDGLYTFDTFGSAYDTVVYVRDGGCDGAELACNDDAAGSAQSQVLVEMTAGQTVMVAVDGGTESGAYELAIDLVPCPDEDLGSTLPESVIGTTIGAFDKLDMLGCGQVELGTGDVAFEWTAPAGGPYTFDLVGSDYDTVLFVQDAACGGGELACNDDAIGLQSAVDVDLAANQTVLIAVSGYAGSTGNFTLNINGS